MPRTLIGSCETPYRRAVFLRPSHYEGKLADVQICVEHMYCKDLGRGVIAAYGSYTVFLLFTYEEFGGKPACFHRMIRQPFSLLFTDGMPDADAFEIQFVPKAAARPQDTHAAEWTVEITATATAAFYEETAAKPPETLISTTAAPVPDKNGQDTAPPPAAETKDPPAASPPAHPADDETPKPTEAPAPETPPDEPNDPPNPTAGGRYWRIRPDASVPPERLLEMEEAPRSAFMEESI